MASKSRSTAKTNGKQFGGALRKSAQQKLESAQGAIKKAQGDVIVAVSSIAQKNILALAGKVDQFGKVLVLVSEKIEPSTRIATNANPRHAARKSAAKAAPKASLRKSAVAA